MPTPPPPSVAPPPAPKPPSDDGPADARSEDVPADEDEPTTAAGADAAGADEPEAHEADAAGPTRGHLQIEDGERIALNRPVLFGRRPPDAVTIDDVEARVVTLSGSDALSRSHAQIRFDGDAVQVVDLGSANHTYVTAPDGEPVRLREHEPFTIEPGSVISLADAVRITFEAD